MPKSSSLVPNPMRDTWTKNLIHKGKMKHLLVTLAIENISTFTVVQCSIILTFQSQSKLCIELEPLNVQTKWNTNLSSHFVTTMNDPNHEYTYTAMNKNQLLILSNIQHIRNQSLNHIE